MAHDAVKFISLFKPAKSGCPDVLGQLKDGRLLGVEVKAEKGRLRPEQTIFLERISASGGVAFMVGDCRDVLRELHLFMDRNPE